VVAESTTARQALGIVAHMSTAEGSDPAVVIIALVRRMVRDGSARRVRSEARLTLSDVGRSLGVAPSTVLRWESGESLPRSPVAERYGLLLAELAAITDEP